MGKTWLLDVTSKHEHDKQTSSLGKMDVNKAEAGSREEFKPEVIAMVIENVLLSTSRKMPGNGEIIVGSGNIVSGAVVITTRMRVGANLKSSVVERGVNLGDHLGRWWLAGTENASKATTAVESD